jgi:hypothetical protein
MHSLRFRRLNQKQISKGLEQLTPLWNSKATDKRFGWIGTIVATLKHEIDANNGWRIEKKFIWTESTAVPSSIIPSNVPPAFSN